MKILILSRDESLYSTQRLKDASLKRGHELLVVDSFETDLRIGKNTDIFYKEKNIINADAIIPRIGALSIYNGVALVKQFESKNVFSTASSEGILLSHDKFKTFQALCNEKINLPKTVLLNSINNIEDAIDFVGGAPLVIKLIEGSQGLGVILAETKNTAISIIETLNRLQTKFLLQEFIKESAGTDIRVFVVDNKVVAAMKREGKKGDFRSNIHRGGVGKKVKLSSDEEELALRATKKMNLGVAGIDILRGKKSPLLLEVNSSPGLEGIEAITKIDIATTIIKFIEKNGS